MEKKSKKTILHGNNARIDPKADITPLYLTNAITDNKTGKNGSVTAKQAASAAFSKRAVDENQK